MSRGFKDADSTQVDTDRELAERIRHVLEVDREQAEHAQKRRAQGGYGTCEDCATTIPPERLAALPEATRCIACQSAWDATHHD